MRMMNKKSKIPSKNPGTVREAIPACGVPAADLVGAN